MYWPLGIPNYYSASRFANAGSFTETHDGTDRDQLTANGESLEQETGQEHSSTSSASAAADHEEAILDIKPSRGGQIFGTITRRALSIWQTKPTVLLARAIRSPQSLASYGENVALLVRPDALIIVVQTAGGYLITYSLASDPNAQVYQLSVRNWAVNGRRQSADAVRRSSNTANDYGAGDGSGIRDISVRFRMVIRIDAGISSAIALDDELVVATTKPAAIQSIRWSPDKSGASHNTELFKRMPWFADKSSAVSSMVFDRPMGLHVWLSTDGRAYAVQRGRPRKTSESSSDSSYKGFCFHSPSSPDDRATHVAVNARFSLVAIGCADSSIRIYTAKDYTGNVPLSHILSPPVSRDTTGPLTFILHSPDGYCTLAGYTNGWATWSVYGKPGATSFLSELPPSSQHWWLSGVSAGFFTGSGSELLLLSRDDRTQFATVEMARPAAVGCFEMSNVHRCLLQTSSGLLLQRSSAAVGTEGDGGAQQRLWHALRYPAAYLSRQWPVKCAVISADGKYIGIAGRRGVAHYSIASGRWKMFDDLYAEDEFGVRGGMGWYQHILVVAVECEGQSQVSLSLPFPFALHYVKTDMLQIRLYSREKPLVASSAIHTETLTHSVIHMAIQDSNSLLVYTHENVLLHYVFDAASASSVRLAQVGQIGFHGIIRAPARVRSISWIVPDEQRGGFSKLWSTTVKILTMFLRAWRSFAGRSQSCGPLPDRR